jgi:hypothetical protein
MGELLTATGAKDGMKVAPVPIFNSRRAAVPVASVSKPEFTLLLAIARIELSADEYSLLKELFSQSLDWAYLLSMAELHGLEPLLFQHLRSVAPEAAPYWVMQTLRANCKATALRNLILSAKLVEVSAHLTSLQIDHIAYKGPLLAEIYGSNGALRAYRDLDLLVPQKSLRAVRDALSEIGFGDKYGLNAAQQAASFSRRF